LTTTTTSELRPPDDVFCKTLTTGPPGHKKDAQKRSERKVEGGSVKVLNWKIFGSGAIRRNGKDEGGCFKVKTAPTGGLPVYGCPSAKSWGHAGGPKSPRI